MISSTSSTSSCLSQTGLSCHECHLLNHAL